MSPNRTTTARPPPGTAAPEDGPRPPFPYGRAHDAWTSGPTPAAARRRTPGPTRCSRCGATTIDVQGLADCPECAHTEVRSPE